MPILAHDAVMRCERQVKSVLNTLQAGFTILPTSDTHFPASGSIGEMIAAVANFEEINPGRDVRKLKADARAKIDAGADQLDAAIKQGDQWVAVADYIESKAITLPHDLDPAMYQAALQVKQAAQAGIINPTTLAQQIRRDATAGLLEIHRVKSSVFPQWLATFKIITAKASLQHYTQCAKSFDASDKRKSLYTRAAEYAKANLEARQANYRKDYPKANRKEIGQ